MDQTLLFTDMGKETTMIFLMNRDLNNFALFECLKDDEGRKKLTDMYEGYIKTARENGVKDLLFLTPTWRTNTAHMTKMGYDASEVEKYNVMAAEFLIGIKNAHADINIKIVGQLGPAGDGYVPGK